MYKSIFFLAVIILFLACSGQKKESPQAGRSVPEQTFEKYRPHFHFTPDSMWMNDPNGLVYYAGKYHLFYQYYPDSTVWGPMHWGHATSHNMMEWQHQPIALFPDEHGYIFSGSAVLDAQNTTGFGTEQNPPLVAIFTYHNPDAIKQNLKDIQSQGIAYSLDSGKTWKKYDKNPVLGNPGIRDFRDPKVRWHEPSQRWIMTLAVRDHIRFYSSGNLKDWTLESTFGGEQGAHGGVWECPDLFPLKMENGEERWILIVSLNPGGSNGGSGTQYFIGRFDGNTFTPDDNEIRWLDYGPDNYAGVTWSNTGGRTLFLGWMSNWKYAQLVPTERWRSAMTIPRELSLKPVNGKMAVCSRPVSEIDELQSKVHEVAAFDVRGRVAIGEKAHFSNPTLLAEVALHAENDFEWVFSNNKGNQLSVAYDRASNQFVIDRSKTGDTSFHEEFGNLVRVPRLEDSDEMNIDLVVDVASLELFVDKGATVSTVIFFPDEPLDQISIFSEKGIAIKKLTLKEVL